MLNALLTGVVSFAFAFLTLPAIIRVAREKKLYDLPDERKLHSQAIASLVTYAMPFVALGWGLLAHETITMLQVGCLGLILVGVYIANRS